MIEDNLLSPLNELGSVGDLLDFEAVLVDDFVAPFDLSHTSLPFFNYYNNYTCRFSLWMSHIIRPWSVNKFTNYYLPISYLYHTSQLEFW